MKLYTAVFKKESEGYSVSFPAIPGCFTEGDSKEEAYENAVEALSLVIETNKDFNPSYKLPEDIDVDDYDLQDGDFTQLVEYKTLKQKAVKKTVTIPYHLNEVVKQMDLNCSQILQQGIKEKARLIK